MISDSGFHKLENRLRYQLKALISDTAQFQLELIKRKGDKAVRMQFHVIFGVADCPESDSLDPNRYESECKKQDEVGNLDK